MTTERLAYLLERRHAGSLSDTELQELEYWYQQQQDTNVPLYNGIDTAREDRLKEALTEQLMNRINVNAHEKKTDSKKRMITRWSVAASVLLIITAISYNHYRHSNAPEANVIAASTSKINTAPERIYIRNTQAVKQTVYLPDSSKVTLYPESSIRYDYNNNARNIDLEGEASFSVQPAASRPFSVSANALKVTALGTSFTVTAYNADRPMQVKLHEGKVVIQSSNNKKMKPVYLQPGDQLSIHPQTLAGTVTHSPVRKTNLASAISRKAAPTTMQFEQEPLVNVLNKLATHYHILITYDQQQIRELDFSGTLRLPDSIEPVLQRISVLNGLSINQTKKGYHVEKK